MSAFYLLCNLRDPRRRAVRVMMMAVMDVKLHRRPEYGGSGNRSIFFYCDGNEILNLFDPKFRLTNALQIETG
jgi:hypothetical protein